MPEPDTAVLLAAGRGTRLRPYTDTTPKPLLPYQGRPTLDWILDSLSRAGIRQCVLVTHHLSAQIEQYAETYAKRHPMKIVTANQPTLNGTATALLAAFDRWPDSLAGRPCLATATDYLVAQDFYAQLLEFHRWHTAPMTISLKQLEEDQLSARSSVRYTGDFDIQEVVEKPAPGTAPSRFTANLIYVLPAGFRDYLQDVEPSPRGEYELQTAVNRWLLDGGTARGLLQSTPAEWTPEQTRGPRQPRAS